MAKLGLPPISGYAAMFTASAMISSTLVAEIPDQVRRDLLWLI